MAVQIEAGRFAVFAPFSEKFEVARIDKVADKTVQTAERELFVSSTYKRARLPKEDVIATFETFSDASRAVDKAQAYLDRARNVCGTRKRDAGDSFYQSIEHARTFLSHEHPLVENFPRNVRINIPQLTAACRALGEVHVLAAGSMYATIALNETERGVLTTNRIHWSFD